MLDCGSMSVSMLGYPFELRSRKSHESFVSEWNSTSAILLMLSPDKGCAAWILDVMTQRKTSSFISIKPKNPCGRVLESCLYGCETNDVFGISSMAHFCVSWMYLNRRTWVVDSKANVLFDPGRKRMFIAGALLCGAVLCYVVATAIYPAAAAAVFCVQCPAVYLLISPLSLALESQVVDLWQRPLRPGRA